MKKEMPVSVTEFRLGKKPAADDDEAEDMDVGAEAKTSAARDLAKALGIDPSSVDTSRVVKALDAYLSCGPAEYEE